jgi:hypothetical protein
MENLRGENSDLGLMRGILQPRGLCEVYPKPVASALVFAGHFGGGMAELLLYVALVDFGRGGEAGRGDVRRCKRVFLVGLARHRECFDDVGQVVIKSADFALPILSCVLNAYRLDRKRNLSYLFCEYNRD